MEIDKKQLEQLENVDMYKTILDHMGEAVWIGDKYERTVRANPKFCEMMEQEVEDMIGRESYDFRDEESTKTVQSNNEKRQEGAASKYEGVLKSKSGKLIPVLVSGTPIPGGGTVGIHTDLREVESLKEAEREMKELNKMKDEFISIVGHELRTPLTAIRGYADMLESGLMGTLNEDQLESIQHINTSSFRLIELVNDMLSISKIESGKMQYYMEVKDLCPIIKAVYNDIKIEAEKRGLKHELICNDIETVKVEVDENKLKQVLLNLLTNAMKFTEEGGTISIKIEDNDTKVKISIIDTGEGIPEDKLADLFGKFTQVETALQRNNTAGLGLGLALVKNFVQKFGGDIKVKSEVGVGSEFYFFLDKK